MSEVVHADIFFFITSIAVVAVTVGVLILLYYAIGIARQVKGLVDRVEKVEKDIEHDIERVRASLREEGVKTKALINVVLGFIGGWITPVRRRRKNASSSSEEQGK